MRSAVLATVVGLFVAAQLPAAVDELSTELERQGVEALERGRPAEAARVLRSACFGLLDLPERLARCLVRLGVAEARANDSAGFTRTFERLEIVEGRFGAVRALGVGALETELGAALRSRIAPELVSGSPLRFLTEDSGGSAVPRGAQPEAAAARVGADSRESAAPANPDPSPHLEAPPAEAAPPPAPAVEPEPTEAPNTNEQAAETIARARRLATTSASEPELVAALTELLPIADQRTDDAELQRLTALLAYRTSRWPLCAERYRLAGVPPEARPLERFYFSVCLVESGESERAAEVLRPVVGALKRSAFVDGYVSRILGARP